MVFDLLGFNQVDPGLSRVSVCVTTSSSVQTEVEQDYHHTFSTLPFDRENTGFISFHGLKCAFIYVFLNK